MKKTILVTGGTDGIGFEAAKLFVSGGHHVLLHGRNPAKLTTAQTALSSLPGAGRVDCFTADLSRLDAVATLATAVADTQADLDVLINNAGVFRTADPITPDGLDRRFVVNTLAPYILTKHLVPYLSPSARVINVSSAAQSPVNLAALSGNTRLNEMEAYAQSKLALTMWSCWMARSYETGKPIVVAVNPGSLLATKMVNEAFGIPGNDIRIGADILARAALSDDFADAAGKYFDNDARQFAPPHPDALDVGKCRRLVDHLDTLVERLIQTGNGRQ